MQEQPRSAISREGGKGKVLPASQPASQPVPHPLSLAAITLADQPAPDMVAIAADAGFSGVSLSAAMTASLGRNRRPSVANDPALRHAVDQALSRTGLRLDIAEGFAVEPDVDFAAVHDALSIMRDLGADRFNLTCWDADAIRARDTLHRYGDVAIALDLGVTIEFTPLSRLASLADAVALIGAIGCERLSVLVDPLHLARCGASPADLALVDPALIGFAQLCDGPALSAGRDAYLDEALYERQVPGEGELPLRAFVAALPPGTILSVEVPQRSLTERGISADDRARRCFEAAHALLAGMK